MPTSALKMHCVPRADVGIGPYKHVWKQNDKLEFKNGPGDGAIGFYVRGLPQLGQKVS
jgi:hypothetical protein